MCNFHRNLTLKNMLLTPNLSIHTFLKLLRKENTSSPNTSSKPIMRSIPIMNYMQSATTTEDWGAGITQHMQKIMENGIRSMTAVYLKLIKDHCGETVHIFFFTKESKVDMWILKNCTIRYIINLELLSKYNHPTKLIWFDISWYMGVIIYLHYFTMFYIILLLIIIISKLALPIIHFIFTPKWVKP